MTEEIKKILENHEQRIRKLEEGLGGNSEEQKVKKKNISLKEFILSKKPESDIQKTLAIGYYLEKYEGFNAFTAKDLEEGFRTARETIPKNVNDKVNWNIRHGHIMDAKEKKDNKKAWVLTSSGERFVENDFKKE